MARNLTKKQRKFVKGIVNGETGVQAALNSYDTEDNLTARVIASENLTKPNIIKSIQDALPDTLLAKVHLEGLKATSIRFTPEGEQIDAPDYATRHKYLDSGYKLKGSYAAEKHVTLNIEAPNDNLKELADALLHRQRD